VTVARGVVFCSKKKKKKKNLGGRGGAPEKKGSLAGEKGDKDGGGGPTREKKGSDGGGKQLKRSTTRESRDTIKLRLANKFGTEKTVVFLTPPKKIKRCAWGGQKKRARGGARKRKKKKLGHVRKSTNLKKIHQLSG